jgi:hypothetical protein
MNGREQWLFESSFAVVGRLMASGGRYAAGRPTVVGWAGPGTFADERCSGAMSRGDAA